MKRTILKILKNAFIFSAFSTLFIWSYVFAIVWPANPPAWWDLYGYWQAIKNIISISPLNNKDVTFEWSINTKWWLKVNWTSLSTIYQEEIANSSCSYWIKSIADNWTVTCANNNDTTIANTNTQLTEAQVDSYVSNNGYDTTPDTIADDGKIQETEIVQNTLDDSEIQDNSLTAASLAAWSVWTSEVLDNSLTASDLAAWSVWASEVVDWTLTYSDTNINSIQRRVTGTCAVGSSIRAISNTGTVTCETDDNSGGMPVPPASISGRGFNGMGSYWGQVVWGYGDDSCGTATHFYRVSDLSYVGLNPAAGCG